MFFLRLFDRLSAHRRFCFWLLAAIIGVLVFMTTKLRYNENIYDFLPMSGQDQRALTLYQDITGGQRVVALIGTDEAAETSDLTAAVDTFALRVQSGSGRSLISDVTTQVDFEQYMGLTDFVYSNIPLMLVDSDYVRMERLLADPNFIRQQLETDLQLMMMPTTGWLAGNVSQDPLGLFSPVLDRLQTRQRDLPFLIDDGYIFTPDGRHALVTLSSPFGALESEGNSRLVSHVESAAQHTMSQCPGITVDVTGAPVIAVGNASQIKADSQWAITIAVTLILTMLIFAFRGVRNLLLIGLANVFGWLFAMGFISVLRSDVSLIVLGIGSIIIGIAANYPLHFIAHHTDHGGTARDVLREMVSPLLIGNITTVGAFASLLPLNAPALRDLGLFAAFTLIGTILFVLVFLPHLVRQRQQKAGPQRPLFGRITQLTPERHTWLMPVILLLTVVFGWFSLGTSFDADMMHINYMTPRQQQVLSELGVAAGVNDSTNVYLVTEASTWDEALMQRQQVAPVLDSLQRAGQIGHYGDVTSFIASHQEQEQRLLRWTFFWQKHRASLLQQLNAQASAAGFSADAFAPFVALLDASYKPQPIKHFAPLRDLLLSGSFSTSTGRCAVVDVIDGRQADRSQVEACLRQALGEHGYAFDFAGINQSVAGSLSDDFNYIGIACSLIVFIFLWLSFGRIELAILSFLPMVIGWLWILGIMQLLGMQFNIVNVILATFIFGQGDDYTIFMTDGLLNEYARGKKLLPSYKNSIIISALIMFIGMGSLIVAQHPALRSLAEVTIVGMLTVVVMAWIVPTLCFRWLVRDGSGQVRQYPVTIMGLFRRRQPVDFGVGHDSHYYHQYLIGRYTYKGYSLERDTQRLLRQHDDFSQWIDAPTTAREVNVIHAGQGQFSLLYALVHPDVEVHSYATDPDDVALLSALEPKPANLHVHAANERAVGHAPVFDLQRLMKAG